jgi:hypothetical protein
MASTSSLAVHTSAAMSTGAAASCPRKCRAAGTWRHSRPHVTVVNAAFNEGARGGDALEAAAAPSPSDVQYTTTAMSCFACPLCAGAMIRGVSSSGEGGGGGSTTLKCDANHSFDVAKNGAVNLNRGGGRRATGDSSEMLRARRRFLGAGHYQEVSRRVNQAVLACIVDVALDDVRPADAAPGATSAAADVINDGNNNSPSSSTGEVATMEPPVLDEPVGSRVALIPGCQIGYLGRAGFHQRMCVLTNAS